MDGVPEPVGKDPKEDFTQGRALFGQPADLRLGHIQLAGVTQQEQQIGGGFVFLGFLVSVHLGQNLQGGLRQLHDPDERSRPREEGQQYARQPGRADRCRPAGNPRPRLVTPFA